MGLPPCPLAPNVTCDRPPSCTTPGATVVLLGSCAASDPLSFDVQYTVAGVPAVTAQCPTAGGSLVVGVQAKLKDAALAQMCPYSTGEGYTLQSESLTRRCPNRWEGMHKCQQVPCLSRTALQPAHSSCPGFLPRAPLLAAPAASACPVAPTVTCPKVPVCMAPNTTVDLTSSCQASDPDAVIQYQVEGVTTTRATCPPPGVALAVQVQASYPAKPDCPYGLSAGYNLTSALAGSEARAGACRRGAAVG